MGEIIKAFPGINDIICSLKYVPYLEKCTLAVVVHFGRLNCSEMLRRKRSDLFLQSTSLI